VPASAARLARVAIALAICSLAWAGCAPVVDGPLERQRAADRDDGARLAALLARLPGAVTAEVVLQRAMRDPLATTPPTTAALSAVITIDDPAQRAAVGAAAERLARAALPGVAPAIEIHAAAVTRRDGRRADALARVGPFTVEASSRAPLKAVLAACCLAIAALAGALAWSAWRHRLGSSAQ
jgi:hypothetical protein